MLYYDNIAFTFAIPIFAYLRQVKTLWSALDYQI